MRANRALATTPITDEFLNKLKKTLVPGNYWAKKAPAITACITNPLLDLVWLLWPTRSKR